MFARGNAFAHSPKDFLSQGGPGLFDGLGAGQVNAHLGELLLVRQLLTRDSHLFSSAIPDHLHLHTTHGSHLVFLLEESEIGTRRFLLPATFKCTQEFVMVTFHSHRALTNKQNIIISHV